MNIADKQYLDLMRDIKSNGRKKEDRTGTGTTSVFNRTIRFDLSSGYFPLLTTKRLHTRSITHELLWFNKGDTNIKYLNDNGVSIWDEWADEKGNLGPVYGKQWVNWGGSKEVTLSNDKNEEGFFEYNENNIGGINQIQNAIDLLNNDPDSRRIKVSAWNVGELDQMALMPCHYGFSLYTDIATLNERIAYWCREQEKDISYGKDMTHSKLDALKVPRRRISLSWTQRSVDTFLGLPFNIASYGMLLHMFAQQVNMMPAELVGNLDNDVHIYDNHWEYVDKQLQRDPNMYSSPKLKLKKAKDMFSYSFEDFEMVDYQYYPNWKNVPIAV